MEPCTTCGETKPPEDFASAGAGKKRKKCKKCLAQQKRDYYKNNPDKAKQRNLMTYYGITSTEFKEMSDAQGGLCGVCQKEKPLCVDHCHTTKKVRGLLCHNCNTAIGLLKEDVGIIEKAILFLQEQRDLIK